MHAAWQAALPVERAGSCYLGWFWPLWDARHQTLAAKLADKLADKIVGSVVLVQPQDQARG